MSKKKGVKKGSPQARAYAERIEQGKQLVSIKDCQFTEQRTLDVVAITMGECFGFGAERMKRFHDYYCKIDDELKAIEKEDAKSDTNGNSKMEQALNGAYSRKKFEDRLERVYGRYYQPRSVRYSYKIWQGDKVVASVDAED